MTREEIKRLPMDVRIEMALDAMYASVIEEHRRLGIPLIQWENGKIVRVSADEAERRSKAQKARPQ